MNQLKLPNIFWLFSLKETICDANGWTGIEKSVEGFILFFLSDQ